MSYSIHKYRDRKIAEASASIVSNNLLIPMYPLLHDIHPHNNKDSRVLYIRIA